MGFTENSVTNPSIMYEMWSKITPSATNMCIYANDNITLTFLATRCHHNLLFDQGVKTALFYRGM